MALQQLVGTGLIIPPLATLVNNQLIGSNDSLLMDADEEESQLIGQVKIDGGGSKTFGTSGSSIGWLPGAAITFLINSQLTVGIKKTSVIDTANGPAARATIGAAAFSVSKQLVGGTDTITSTTWRTDSMNAGTPFTITDGDLAAVCFHLNSTGGAPSVKVRCITPTNSPSLPCSTLVTSGPTYTAINALPNVAITFDDGTLGWLENSLIFSVADVSSANVGNGNINANIFRLPFPCQIDALTANASLASNATNFNVELYDTPLGTPKLLESVVFDANVTSAVAAQKLIIAKLATPRTLLANTDYAVGVKSTTANNLLMVQHDVNASTHFKAEGMGPECYAAISTAGATFVQQNSGKRRWRGCGVRVSALDDGAGFPTTFGVRGRRG